MYVEPHVQEILHSIAVNLDQQPFTVIECLRVLFISTFAPDGTIIIGRILKVLRISK